jgi:hypothetical protein
MQKLERNHPPPMRITKMLFGAVFYVSVAVSCAAAQTGTPKTPADGHTIHVVAPHVINGKVVGPYHHYCKVLSPEPVIECLLCESADPGGRLEGVEYILTKSLTRNGSVTLDDWHKYWHDHKQEIGTGRLQVLDVPPDQAKKVGELISTTDGIIFHLWGDDQEVPSGRLVTAQSVGHLNLTEPELQNGAKESPNVSKK